MCAKAVMHSLMSSQCPNKRREQHNYVAALRHAVMMNNLGVVYLKVICRLSASSAIFGTKSMKVHKSQKSRLGWRMVGVKDGSEE